MKSFLVTVLALVLLVGTTYAQGKKDAELMVKKAITYYRSVGKDKALLDFCDRKGRFVEDGLYITVYDQDGKCLANGGDLKLLGKNQMELKDSDGKAIIKERLEIAKNDGKGWQTYKWKNPESGEFEVKNTYIEKADEVIFACGTYSKK